MLKKTLILLGIVIVIFIVFNYAIMPYYVSHYETVKVPRLTGMNVIEAKDLLEKTGLDIKEADIKYDEKIPIGQIIDQNPPADVMVKSGRRVYVTVCGGEQLAEVPGLKGRTLRDAKFALEQRGLKLGETVRKNTNEFPQDVVVSQIIQPGSKVKKNTSIELIVSNGPIIGDLKVPTLVGKTLEEAKKIITDAKLKVGKVTYQTNNDLPAGQIVDQYPKADRSANENTSVELFVAKKKPVIQKDEEAEVEGNADINSGDKSVQTNVKDEKKDAQKDNAGSQSEQPKGTDKPKESDNSKDKQAAKEKPEQSDKEQPK